MHTICILWPVHRMVVTTPMDNFEITSSSSWLALVLAHSAMRCNSSRALQFQVARQIGFLERQTESVFWQCGGCMNAHAVRDFIESNRKIYETLHALIITFNTS